MARATSSHVGGWSARPDRGGWRSRTPLFITSAFVYEFGMGNIGYESAFRISMRYGTEPSSGYAAILEAMNRAGLVHRFSLAIDSAKQSQRGAQSQLGDLIRYIKETERNMSPWTTYWEEKWGQNLRGWQHFCFSDVQDAVWARLVLS